MSRDPREIVREEPLRRAHILAALADGPHTVPEIAATIGAPEDETMFWVMGMRKYGLLVELPQPEGDHYRYGAVGR
jgi:predicted transcriptional regulator